MGNVFKLYPKSLAPDFRYEPSDILADAAEVELVTMFVVGEKPDGTLWVSGNSNMAELNMFLDRAKAWIVHGDPDE